MQRNERTSAEKIPQAFAIAACLFASLLIVASYSRLSHTWDEPTHVAAGLEWLETNHYRFQTENPPLSRVALALLPYLRGTRVTAFSDDWTRVPVEDVFYRGSYTTNVTQARVGHLVFFWIVLLETWVLSGGRKQPTRAALATALVATMPPVVAHAGLATTDLAFVAAFLACVGCWKRLLAAPSTRHALWFGTSLGIALSTKFSIVPFFPPVALALLAIELAWRGRGATGGYLWQLGRAVVPAMCMTAFVIWAAYGFHVGRLSEIPGGFGPYGQVSTTGIVGRLRNVPLPAHEFLHGLLYVGAHGAAGHGTYVMGRSSDRGFWFFYPVALSVKTPPLTLLLMAAAIGALFSRRRDHEWMQSAGYSAGAALLLAVAAFSPLNLGVRHVLVVYPLLLMAGAAVVARALERHHASRWALPVLISIIVGAQTASLAHSYPNQLAYFNALAGPDPGWVLSDSDLDWGQDVIALERHFATHPAAHAYLLGNGSALWCRHRLPHLTPLPTTGETPGVIAVFGHPYRLKSRGPMVNLCGSPIDPQNYSAVEQGWLDWLHRREPFAYVGAGVRIYRVTDVPAPTVDPAARYLD